MMPTCLHLVNLFKMANGGWMTAAVMSADLETFNICSPRHRLAFRDEDLKPDKRGRYIINIEPLDFKFFYPNVDLPKVFEMPREVLEARKEKRRLNALEKAAVFIDRSGSDLRYFFTDGEKLRLLQGEKEIVADVELIHGRAAVNVEALELGHPYLELPVEVARKFTHVLDAKRLQKISLLPAGENLLNGKDYFKLSQSIPENIWHTVERYFEFFEGEVGDLQGWVTSEPNRVAGVLGIPNP